MKRIHYVCGSRADFGLMRETLQTLDVQPDWCVSIVATGQALEARYGAVIGEIEAAGLHVAHQIEAPLSGAGAHEMARAFSREVDGFGAFWEQQRPDLVLVLGDRGEMLAATIVAYHLGIPVGHLHGGERSGTLDEGFRHAISKLATFHFPATSDAATRLVRMGEQPDTVQVIGAPGLVAVARRPATPAGWLVDRFGLAGARRTALVLFHPVVQEAARAYAQMDAVLDAVDRAALDAIVLRPNSDAGGALIDRRIDEWCAAAGGHKAIDHLPRDAYLHTLDAVDLLIGNSSSGILESASLGTPCLNLGSRQDGRERNDNTVDCALIEPGPIAEAIGRALALAGPFANRYGDGRADEHLVAALRKLNVSAPPPAKRNAY